jgi:hypothetical protein
VNRASATFPCRHRYTNLTICATPCDNKDDFCLDNLDEVCTKLSVELAILFVILLLLLTVILGESFYRLAKKNEIETCFVDKNYVPPFDWEMNEKKTFCKKIKQFHISESYKYFLKFSMKMITQNFALQWRSRIQSIHKIEREIHRGNMKNFHVCIKDILGTNHNTEMFYSLNEELSLKEKLKAYVRTFKHAGTWTDFYTNTEASVWINHCVLGIFRIVLYYIDLIKDIFFVIVYVQYVPISTVHFFSFNNIIFVLLCIIIIVPLFANFVLLLVINPFANCNSNAIRLGFAALFPVVPGVSCLSHNCNFTIDFLNQASVLRSFCKYFFRIDKAI